MLHKCIVVIALMSIFPPANTSTAASSRWYQAQLNRYIATAHLIADFEHSPTSLAAFLGDYAEFICTIRKGLLFWFINGTFVSSILSDMYVSVVIYPNGMGENSTLQILAAEVTNNSQIQCGVDTSGSIDQFSEPALFLVQGTIAFWL